MGIAVIDNNTGILIGNISASDLKVNHFFL